MIPKLLLVAIILNATYFFILTLTACTYTVNVVHTEGTASDVVDETTSQQPNISPTITGIPLNG